MGWQRASDVKVTSDAKATPVKTSSVAPIALKVAAPDVLEIDTREPDTMCALADQFHLKYVMRTFDAGDLGMGNAVGERKEIHDFIGSYQNTRIFDQLDRLSKQTTIPMLFISGRIEDLKLEKQMTNFDPNQFIGALGSCLCRYNINVFWVQDDTEIMRLCKILLPLLKDVVVAADRPQTYTMLAGHIDSLRSKWSVGNRELAESVANIIKAGSNVIWVYDNYWALRATAALFQKINEGKYCAPRDRLVKKSGMGRSTDLVSSYLRIEDNLAASLVKAAEKKKKGVIRYIMDSPDYELLGHSGMGPVTLKRIREMLG